MPENLLRLRRAERAPAPRGGRAPRARLVHYGALELRLKGGAAAQAAQARAVFFFSLLGQWRRVKRFQGVEACKAIPGRSM